MTLKQVAIGAAAVLAGAVLFLAGHNYAKNKELSGQVDELTETVRKLVDARAADEAVMTERDRRLREIDDDARQKRERLDEAAMADTDSDFLDSLRRMFSGADVPDK